MILHLDYQQLTSYFHVSIVELMTGLVFINSVQILIQVIHLVLVEYIGLSK